MGVTAEYISRIERGGGTPGLETLMRLARETGVAPSTLLCGEFLEAPSLGYLETRLDRVSPEVRRAAVRAIEAILDYEERARRR